MTDDRRWDLECHLAAIAWEWLCDSGTWSGVTVKGEKYVLPDDDVYEKVAGDDEFGRLILQRESDGKLFEVELDATVFVVEVPDGQDEHAAVEGVPDVQGMEA